MDKKPMQDPSDTKDAKDADSRARGRLIAKWLMRFRAFLALILVSVVFVFAAPSFLTVSNLMTIVVQASINGLMAIGMTFVIVSAGIDLSVGAIAGLCGMVVGALIDIGIPVPWLGVVIYPHAWVVILIGIGVGALLGAVNGFIITRMKVTAFIATLGMLYVARGLAIMSNNGSPFPFISGTSEHGNTGLGWLGSGVVLGIPVPIWVLVIFTIIGIGVAQRTKFGRHVYAVGGNQRAAHLSGVRVLAVTARVYVISGALAGLAGIIIAAQLDSSGPAAGTGYELNAIAAAVLGGTSLMGGKGTVGGSVIGALVIATLVDGLILMGLPEYWQMIVTGGVIIVAVALDQVQPGSIKFPWLKGRGAKVMPEGMP